MALGCWTSTFHVIRVREAGRLPTGYRTLLASKGVCGACTHWPENHSARSGTTVSGIVSRPISVAVLSSEGGEERKGC